MSVTLPSFWPPICTWAPGTSRPACVKRTVYVWPWPGPRMTRPTTTASAATRATLAMMRCTDTAALLGRLLPSQQAFAEDEVDEPS
jgi:hypothetical protein